MHNELLANKTFNSETSRSSGLIPGQLRTDANGMISFLEEYYRLSNATGNPTNLINDFLREHDIDSVTETFFSGIQNLIAKNIPVSTIFDRQTLYKRIIDYYSLRGSAASVKAFFKIFYNENASIYYPKDDLFKPSDGQFVRSPIWRDARNYATAILAPNDWVNSDIADDTTSNEYYILSSIGNLTEADFLGTYSNTNSFPSESRLKIQDGIFWQNYSYEINNALSIDIWQNDYLKLVHPAGLRYFHKLLLLAYANNSLSVQPHVADIFQETAIIETISLYIVTSSPVFNEAEINIEFMSFMDFSNAIPGGYYSLNQLNLNSTDYMNYLKFLDQSAISGYVNEYQPGSQQTLPERFIQSYVSATGAPASRTFPPTAIGSIITVV